LKLGNLISELLYVLRDDVAVENIRVEFSPDAFDGVF